MSFIGLYLLGFELSNSRNSFKEYRSYIWLIIYISCAIAGSILAFTFNGPLNSFPYKLDMYSYTSPFVIIGAVSLVMLFSRLSIRSKLVSKVALSAFAVYLFHIGNFIWPIVSHIWKFLFDTYSYSTYLLLSTLISLLIYVFSILVDRIRLILWSKINGIAYENHNNSSGL